jgi:hypothetical protein
VHDRFGTPVSCRFAQVKSLPRTPDKEIDRDALAQESRGNSHIAPRNDVETLVSNIWREVLQHERIGVHDNFFALGGHSLRATQVLSRLASATGVELSLGNMFEDPTVEGLSLKIQEHRATSSNRASSDRAAMEDLLAEIETT